MAGTNRIGTRRQLREATSFFGMVALSALAVLLAQHLLRPSQAAAQAGQAQQPLPATATRASAVAGWFAAEGRGDADAAMAEFAANGIFAAASGPCNRAAPCSDAASILAKVEDNIGKHNCHTIVELDVAGAIVTGRMENRDDTNRAKGVERGIQAFLALVPQDKITYLTIVPDVGDPETALNQAIGAGSAQPANPPIPNPPTPCAGA